MEVSVVVQIPQLCLNFFIKNCSCFWMILFIIIFFKVRDCGESPLHVGLLRSEGSRLPWLQVQAIRRVRLHEWRSRWRNFIFHSSWLSRQFHQFFERFCSSDSYMDEKRWNQCAKWFRRDLFIWLKFIPSVKMYQIECYTPQLFFRILGNFLDTCEHFAWKNMMADG